MNESFGSTTLQRRAAASAPRSCSRSSTSTSLCVFVTFVDELASLGDSTVSMMSTVCPTTRPCGPTRSCASPPTGWPTRPRSPTKYGLTYEPLDGADRAMKAFLMHRDSDFDSGASCPPTRTTLIAGSRARHVCSARWPAATRSCSRSPGARCCRAWPTPTRSSTARSARRLPRQPGGDPGALRARGRGARGASSKVWGGLSRDSPKRAPEPSVQMLECWSASCGGCASSPTSTPRSSARRGSSGSSRCSPSELDDDYFDRSRSDLDELRFKRRDADQRPARRRQQGRRPRAPARQRDRAGSSGCSIAPGYTFTIPERDENGFRALARARGQGRQRRSPTRSRSRSTTSSASSRCCGSSWLLRRLREPARAARRARASPSASRPRTAREPALSARGPLRRLPGADHRAAGRRQRPDRRRQDAGDDHRRQPGRQVDVPAQRRPGAADDAGRDVRRRASRSAPTSATGCSPTTSARKTQTMESGKLDEELRG